MRTAVIFPGQGSQRPGMGTAWRGTLGWQGVADAGEVLGRDVAALLLEADAETLRATREAQLTTYLASLLAWDACGLHPVVVAGHSLGELTALVAAGLLDRADGLRLVAARGKAMQDAADARPGTMAAVLGLDEDAVEQVCEGVEGAWPANYNAPSHVVVSGTVSGVAAAGAALKQAGARRVLPLPVGGAFHTPLMQPAQQVLDTALAAVTFRPAALSVLSGTDLREYEHPEPAAQTLSRQLTAPVRWRQLLETLHLYGVERVVELGPGGVLAGLVKRTLPGVQVISAATPEQVAALGR